MVLEQNSYGHKSSTGTVRRLFHQKSYDSTAPRRRHEESYDFEVFHF